MPKNKVSDPITDQEIAFARLVLSGAMTDRQAAQAVGLNPDSAAYTKSKPHVRAWMLEHRAAIQQQLVQQEAEGLRRRNLDREKVLDRLLEIANLSPDMTRGSIAGQVKALSMIVAIEGLIPDRRATSHLVTPSLSPRAEPRGEGSAPAQAHIYPSSWRAKQQATTPATMNDTQPTPAPPQEEAKKEDLPGRPGVPWKPAPGSAAEAPPGPGPSQSTFASPSSPSKALPADPYGPGFSFVPDARGPFSIKKNPFARPR